MGIEVLKGDNPGLYSKSKILKVTIEVCPNLQYSGKSTQMTYFFQRDSEVWIQWTFNIPWAHGRGFMNGSKAN